MTTKPQEKLISQFNSPGTSGYAVPQTTSEEWKETKGDRIVTPGGQEIYFENDTDTCHLTRDFVIEIINSEREALKQQAIAYTDKQWWSGEARTEYQKGWNDCISETLSELNKL